MFARTPRLLLRPGWSDDAAALATALNDENIARNLGRVPHPYTLEDAQAFLGRPGDARHPRLLAFLRTHGAPRLIGGCGLTPAADGRAELGYWIARPYWGLGFATEASRALLQAARTFGARAIIARHAIDNPASGRVLRKLGFRATGDYVRTPSTGRGEEVLTALYAAEDESEDAMRADFAAELYADSSVLAA